MCLEISKEYLIFHKEQTESVDAEREGKKTKF